MQKTPSESPLTRFFALVHHDVTALSVYRAWQSGALGTSFEDCLLHMVLALGQRCQEQQESLYRFYEKTGVSPCPPPELAAGSATVTANPSS